MTYHKKVSSDWILNQLSGHAFPNTGEAYNYIKKCLEDDYASHQATEQTSTLSVDPNINNPDDMGYNDGFFGRGDNNPYPLGSDDYDVYNLSYEQGKIDHESSK